jgi:hypothetical protein
MENDRRCVICGAPLKCWCKCPRQDSICENGHEFHYSPYHSEYHLGHSDHGTDTFGPDCCKDKIKITRQPLETGKPIPPKVREVDEGFGIKKFFNRVFKNKQKD